MSRRVADVKKQGEKGYEQMNTYTTAPSAKVLNAVSHKVKVIMLWNSRFGMVLIHRGQPKNEATAG